MLEKLLTIGDVAEILGCSVQTVRRMAADGRLPPPRRFGRRTLRWRASTIDAWLADAPEAEPAPPITPAPTTTTFVS